MLNYINNYIDILSTLKVDEIIEKHKKTKNANIPEDFESLLIKEEATIRKHISLVNKLRLENATLKEDIKTLKKDKKDFDDKINKIKEEYENKIKEMNNKIEKLNIIKNEIEKSEKKYKKKFELNQDEINNLKIKLNNFLMKDLKNNGINKSIPTIIDKKFKKSNSMKLNVKYRINNSERESLQKNSKLNNSNIHPNSSRNIYKINYIMQLNKISKGFPEPNNIFNYINKGSKTNSNLVNNKNNIFNGLIEYNQKQIINDSDTSIFKKIKQNFNFLNNSKNLSINDIKSEKGGIVKLKNIKENKILLLPRNNNNIIKRTFSSINKMDENDNYEEFIKKNNNKKNYLINEQQDFHKINLIYQTPKKFSNKNTNSNINDGKNEFKKINKFRISSINKDTLNKEEMSFKIDMKQKQFLPNKIIDNKNMSNTKIDLYTNNSINKNNITAFKVSTKKNKKINYETKNNKE